jgi:hypothetical protein
MAQQAVAVLLVGTFITGGNFLIALIVVEAFSLGLHESEVKKRIRQGLGDRLHESLNEQIDEKRAFVYDAIGQRFRSFASAMTEALQRQIDEVRAEQERILGQKRDEHFSVGIEKRRLDAVRAKLLELLGEVGESAYGV